MKKLIIAGVVSLSAYALAQSRFPPINLFNGDPTGTACTGNLIQQSSTTGLLYTCQASVMKVQGNPSSGSVIPSPQFSLFYQPNSGTQAAAQGDPNVTTDGSGNVTGKTIKASVNKILMVTAPPYNAYCDAATPSTLTLTSGSAVTSGVTFTSADVGKTFTAGGASSGTTYQMQGAILSVSSGNATLSFNAPLSVAIPVGHWFYGHDDQAAIQAAFTDALIGSSNALCTITGCSIQYPAGKCLSSTITYNGQSFFGAGIGVTELVGMPGQDNFQSPDSAITMDSAYIHDLLIDIDTSVNKAATAGGGDNTFPNRISGTAGGTTPLTVPIAMDGFTFGAATPLNCFGSMTSGSAILTLCSTSFFTSIPPSFLVGQPVSVSNAGSAGGGLTSTVASVTDVNHVVLANTASTTTTTATGYIGTPSTVVTKTPWYFGNCGIALPSSSGTALAAFNNATISNVQFSPINRAYPTDNHTCAMFMQANEYDNSFENIKIVSMFGGLIEAPPASNNSSYFAWTPDTNNYKNVNFYQNTIPMVWYNGIHRTANGINIYSLGADFGVGLMQIGSPLGSSNTNQPSATITRYYNECNTWNGGEIARFSGRNTNISGGSLGQCASKGYINWMGNESTINAHIGPSLQVAGYNNTFLNSHLGASSVTDTGWNNRVYGGPSDAVSGRTREINRDPIPALPPLNELKGAAFAAGISATPVPNMDDLVTTCNDYYVVTSGSFSVSCVNDPTGTELTKTYMVKTGAGGFFTQGSTNNYSLLAAGPRFPLAQVYAITQGQLPGCASTCTGTLAITDLTAVTTLKSCSVTYTAAWVIDGGPNSAHPCLVDFSTVTYGDLIGFNWTSFSGSPTETRLAFLAYEPVNVDVVQEVLTNTSFAVSIAGQIQATTSGTPPLINAKQWLWTSNTPGVLDATSPVGFSTAVTNAGTVISANGSTNLNAGYGGIVQAAPSIVTVAAQSPTVVSNTLNGSILSTDTSIVMNSASTSAYPAAGCFLIDQEVICYSGTPTVGTTTFSPVTRGQWGTTAQAHSNGAASPLVPIGRLNVICNSITLGNAQIIFTNNWTYYSAFVPMQYCSGYPVTFQIGSLTNVPTAQITKVASISVAQVGGNNSAASQLVATPTAANQIPVSAQIGAGPFSYNTNTTMAALLASPPAIGGTAPAAVAATTVTASGVSTFISASTNERVTVGAPSASLAEYRIQAGGTDLWSYRNTASSTNGCPVFDMVGNKCLFLVPSNTMPASSYGGGANGAILGGTSTQILGTLTVGATKFTTSGCSISATAGNGTAGTFTLGANTCTAIVTLNGATGMTAATGWTCQAHDRTAPTVLIGGESSSTTTTASFTIPAGAGATDVISFDCRAF